MLKKQKWKIKYGAVTLMYLIGNFQKKLNHTRNIFLPGPISSYFWCITTPGKIKTWMILQTCKIVHIRITRGAISVPETLKMVLEYSKRVQRSNIIYALYSYFTNIYLDELTFAITFSKTHAKMIGTFESKVIFNIKSDNIISTLFGTCKNIIYYYMLFLF